MQFKTLSRHCILMKNYIGTNLKLHQTSMLVKERLWSNKFSPFSKMEHCNQTNPRRIFTTLVANKADIFSGTMHIFENTSKNKTNAHLCINRFLSKIYQSLFIGINLGRVKVYFLYKNSG